MNTSQHESNKTQHESAWAQHESTRVQHKSTRINTSLIQINTSPTQVITSWVLVNTSLKQFQITRKRINMAKQNPNITYQWCFLEIFVGNYYVSQGFNFSSPIYFQLYHVVLLFYKGICFIMHHNTVTLLTTMQQITISEKFLF